MTRVLQRYEDLLWPDLFIAAAAVSAASTRSGFRAWRTVRRSFLQLLNTAGIVGAALASSDDLPDAVETGIAP